MFKTKLVVYFYIKVFIAIIAGEKVTILSVIPSRLLVKLNAKPTNELLTNYKRAFTNTLEDKALEPDFLPVIDPTAIANNKRKRQKQEQSSRRINYIEEINVVILK